MNVKLLRKIKRYILAEPRRLAMDSWGKVCSVEVAKKDKGLPPCGTEACIAGTAAILGGVVKPSLILEKEIGGGFTSMANANGYVTGYGFPDNTESKARKLLGLGLVESRRLFFFKEWSGKHGWPEKFSDAYQEATTAEERAAIAAQRIDHFIKTKGAE